MRTDSKLYVKSCKVCSYQRKANVKAKDGRRMYHAPGERLYIDIFTTFSGKSGRESIHIGVDMIVIVNILP